MNNNGMIKYKESFIIQIKKFFKKLFGKKEEQYNYCQQEPVLRGSLYLRSGSGLQQGQSETVPESG